MNAVTVNGIAQYQQQVSKQEEQILKIEVVAKMKMMLTANRSHHQRHHRHLYRRHTAGLGPSCYCHSHRATRGQAWSFLLWLLQT